MWNAFIHHALYNLNTSTTFSKRILKNGFFTNQNYSKNVKWSDWSKRNKFGKAIVVFADTIIDNVEYVDIVYFTIKAALMKKLK